MRSSLPTVTLLVGLACVGSDPVLAAPTLSLENPSAVVDALADMGYAPEPISDLKDPRTTVTDGDSTYTVALGGCEKGKNCTYLVLIGAFDDIINPPLEWVAAKNVEYDYIKVWVADDKRLTYSAGLVGNGLTREHFRAAVDLFDASSTNLAQDAIKDKLTK